MNTESYATGSPRVNPKILVYVEKNYRIMNSNLRHRRKLTPISEYGSNISFLTEDCKWDNKWERRGKDQNDRQ